VIFVKVKKENLDKYKFQVKNEEIPSKRKKLKKKNSCQWYDYSNTHFVELTSF